MISPAPILDIPLVSSFGRTLQIDWSTAGPLVEALREILPDFPVRFSASPTALLVRFVPRETEADASHVEWAEETCTIHYGSRPAALRALAGIMGCLGSALPFPAGEEKSCFSKRGVMVDTSRNAVPKVETLRYLIRRLALMGLNRLFLYCEDTYEIPGEPFFGYFRGRYTSGELREIDDYAEIFGIEVIPCIQTLGHCEQMLQWPAYRALRDTSQVLLADQPETYQFIGKMLDAISAPFRSREIHIGMDEAHGIGSGIYRHRHGLRRPFDILASHLQQVTDLCLERGLKPRIWSDMFFRLGSETNHYYDRASSIPEEAAKAIPAEVSLVYWDYYHRNTEFYDDWIQRHRTLGQTPIFAGGVWTWNRFWTQMPHSQATLNAGLAAARRNRLEEVFVTLWGDDGMEGDLLSALPGIQYFADECFGNTATSAWNFRGSSGGDWNAWLAAGNLDELPESPAADGESPNPAKWLLWSDPLLGFLEAHLPRDGERHFSELAESLEAASGHSGMNSPLAFPAALARVLALKLELHRSLRSSYQAGNRAALERLVSEVIPKLLSGIWALRKQHRELWHMRYKPFGWEVVDRRYGGLLARLESTLHVLSSHLENAHARIPELEEIPEALCPEPHFSDWIINHARAASPSVLQ